MATVKGGRLLTGPTISHKGEILMKNQRPESALAAPSLLFRGGRPGIADVRSAIQSSALDFLNLVRMTRGSGLGGIAVDNSQGSNRSGLLVEEIERVEGGD